MAETQLYRAPLLRKKRVPNYYAPNTYRVISTEAEKLPCIRPEVKANSFEMPVTNLIGQPATYENVKEKRCNKPNPSQVTFLQGNVRCMNDPVCHVRTEPLKKFEHDWWPSRTSSEPLLHPPYAVDSCYRREYHHKKHVHGFTRHESNPNKSPTHGIVPVNLLHEPNLKQRLWKEGISYEHQFNSRADPSYPIRGKRQGSFVWSKFSPSETDKILHSHGFISDKKEQYPDSNTINIDVEHTTKMGTMPVVNAA